MENLPISKNRMSGSLYETLYLSRDSAKESYQDFIRTEHLLGGLVNCSGTNIIKEFLELYGICKSEISQRIELAAPSPISFKINCKPDFNPRCKQVLNYAENESEFTNYPKVGTGHLLLGLIREPIGLAGELLRDTFSLELNSSRDFVREYYQLKNEL